MIEEERSEAALSPNNDQALRVAQLWRQILSLAVIVLILLIVFLLTIITLFGVFRGNGKSKNDPITDIKPPETSLPPSPTPSTSPPAPTETVAVFTLPPSPPPSTLPITTITPSSRPDLIGNWNLTYVVPYTYGSCFYNWTIQLILSLNADHTFIVSFVSTDLACYSGTTVRWACDTSFSQCPSNYIPNVLTAMKLYGLWAGNIESSDGNDISGKLILQSGMTYNCTENRQNWPPNARGTTFYSCSNNLASFIGSFDYMIARGNGLNYLFLKPGWATVITNSGTQAATSVLYHQ